MVGDRFAKFVNEAAATRLSNKQIHTNATQYTRLYTLQEAINEVFNPKSPFYWRRGAEFVAKNSTELPKGTKIESYEQEEAYFKKLMARKDLIRWINSPLKKV